MKKENLKKRLYKKCFDCRKKFHAKSDNDIFCRKCLNKVHKITTGVLKIYDKI